MAISFLWTLISSSLLAQGNTEMGLPFIYNFTPKTYNALPQNWDITQDNRGVMYFGNNHGVLEYDGSDWRAITVSNGSPVKSLDTDQHGRVYVGALNEFGYLQADSAGKLQYIKLSEQLDASCSDFDYIWATHVTSRGVIFQAREYLFIWNNDSLQAIPHENLIHVSFYINGTYYSRVDGVGLCKLEGDQLVLVPDGEIFADIFVYGMIPVNSSKILIITDISGIFMMEFNGGNNNGSEIYKHNTKIDEVFEYIEIYNAQKLENGKIAIGTWSNGVIIVDSLWNILSVLDKNTGLQNPVIQSLFLDRTGHLWLALSNGISRVEVNSHLSSFPDQTGIESITRFNNTIYFASKRGLFSLEHETHPDLPDVKTAVFKAVKGLEDNECWDVLTYRNKGEELLLVVTNNYVMEVSKEHEREIILEEIPYQLYQSKLDPCRVYVGLESGLTSLYREKGKWINEGMLEGIDEMILHLSEDVVGNLWMGTQDQGIIRLNILSFKDKRLQDINITKFDSVHGLPEGPFVITQRKGPMIIATNRGLYKYIFSENKFIPDTTYGKQFADSSHYIHRIAENMEPDIWMVTAGAGGERPYELGYLMPSDDDRYDWISKPFTKISEGLIQDIFIDGPDIVWLGGSDGLYRFNRTFQKNYEIPYHAMIRDVSLSAGESIFAGTYFNESGFSSLEQPDQLMLTLPYANNSLVFNYAAQSGEDESFMMYTYFLEGNDRDWSTWTSETKKEYTNLHEGEYTFRVKAKNIYGNESSIAVYKFNILAPWYRKWWAYVLYVILATVIVYTIVKVYTRQLREIIRERTAEVVRQKDEIEEKNRDIMDSIQYAKKIQTALLPPEDDMGKLNMDGFILFLPRDIVSGDFYWIGQKNGKVVTVAADCTGHGVPGAFMSMLGLSFLNNIIGEAEDVKANEILNELRSQVIQHLRQKGQEGEQKDGMDLALHIIDQENKKLEFAGANNPLIMIRNDELIQLKGDRMPIGIHELADQPFVNNEMEIFAGDVLYTFSDGFQDQFGGPKDKKFMIKRMKEIFLEIHKKPMEEQKQILHKAFTEWIETAATPTEQVDDVILIGIRI